MLSVGARWSCHRRPYPTLPYPRNHSLTQSKETRNAPSPSWSLFFRASIPSSNPEKGIEVRASSSPLCWGPSPLQFNLRASTYPTYATWAGVNLAALSCATPALSRDEHRWREAEEAARLEPCHGLEQIIPAGSLYDQMFYDSRLLCQIPKASMTPSFALRQNRSSLGK